ncbi:SPOSA6832_00147, partial [Sporobolomyces salmonicolor]
MLANQADGCAMLEAHEDAEVFRLRLGKALDFEFNEVSYLPTCGEKAATHDLASQDSFAGLFQRRDPREAGPILDIERALAKLEKASRDPVPQEARAAHRSHRPERSFHQGCICGLYSFFPFPVFLSDNFHTYRHLKRSATRMHTLSIRDLTPRETHTFLSGTHERLFPSAPPVTPEQSLTVWDLIGGRLNLLAKVVKRMDVEEAAKDLVSEEKEWLHSKLGLIVDHDDDVMDEQKVSSCSFLLFQHFAKLASAPEAHISAAIVQSVEEPVDEAEKSEALELDLVNALPDELDPKVTYREAREIMTRPDYIVDLDAWHIINVDQHHNVRPDSRLMLSVFREIAAEEDFQEKLDSVRDRVDEIEHEKKEERGADDDDDGDTKTPADAEERLV